jgi:hypothetical protein
MNVAARVCRSPDSWLWTDHSQISLKHSPTPPKCSTRAIMALINNLGIVYHQYCSSSILLGSDFEVPCHLWSQNDVIMSWLRLTATSNCFPHPYYTYTMCLSTLICCPLAYSSSLTQFYPHYLDQILRFWVIWDDVIMSWLRLTATSNYGWNRMWSSMHSMPQWLQASAIEYLSFSCNPCY